VATAAAADTVARSHLFFPFPDREKRKREEALGGLGPSAQLSKKWLEAKKNETIVVARRPLTSTALKTQNPSASTETPEF